MEKIYYNNNEVGEDAIKSFSGKWFFLSNFYRCHVPYDGIDYLSSEAAFQAQKTLDLDKRKEFAEIEDPGVSKKKGKKVSLRSDWEEVKEQIMYEIVKSKFDNNSDLKLDLMDTDDRELYEGNTWNDTTWGVVQKDNQLVGKNKLGKILMKIREEYKKS